MMINPIIFILLDFLAEGSFWFGIVTTTILAVISYLLKLAISTNEKRMDKQDDRMNKQDKRIDELEDKLQLIRNADLQELRAEDRKTNDKITEVNMQILKDMNELKLKLTEIRINFTK